jgi:hypothetical protein
MTANFDRQHQTVGSYLIVNVVNSTVAEMSLRLVFRFFVSKSFRIMERETGIEPATFSLGS